MVSSQLHLFLYISFSGVACVQLHQIYKCTLFHVYIAGSVHTGLFTGLLDLIRAQALSPRQCPNAFETVHVIADLSHELSLCAAELIP